MAETTVYNEHFLVLAAKLLKKQRGLEIDGDARG
jgi:hypothetical protein